ncbi:MAG TPA: phosphoribosylanthranilate isomerase [Acidimicrobiales bacterium]|nr:phosphoribosylanthranilate isomerase [Acidimicrobiales bacterium]
MWVKICGTTSEDDALLAVAMGADAVGFIFAPSKRQVAPSHVADIVKRLPPEVVTVGVFRDESPSRVAQIVLHAGLQGAQLHGHESPADTARVHERVRFLIKAFPAGDQRVRRAGEWGADAVMLDAPSAGSGQVFDWALTGELPSHQRLVIAGGLTPANVAAAIDATAPWGVDVATGVERSPGQKDPVKLREFIAAAKAAGSRLPAEAPPADPGVGPYDWQEDRA